MIELPREKSLMSNEMAETAGSVGFPSFVWAQNGTCNICTNVDEVLLLNKWRVILRKMFPE